MSFDIFYQPCRYGAKRVKQKNPVTKEEEHVFPNESLTPAELKAVKRILTDACADGPDRFGCYVIEVEDGGGAEVFGKRLKHGCMAALGDLTPGMVSFLFDLLKAGNWVMCPALDDNIAIACSLDKVWGAPKDFPEIVPCETAEELGVLLNDGFAAWKKFRARAARAARKQAPRK